MKAIFMSRLNVRGGIKGLSHLKPNYPRWKNEKSRSFPKERKRKAPSILFHPCRNRKRPSKFYQLFCSTYVTTGGYLSFRINIVYKKFVLNLIPISEFKFLVPFPFWFSKPSPPTIVFFLQKYSVFVTILFTRYLQFKNTCTYTRIKFEFLSVQIRIWKWGVQNKFICFESQFSK